jgi:hypothetical protein
MSVAAGPIHHQNVMEYEKSRWYGIFVESSRLQGEVDAPLLIDVIEAIIG